VREEETVTSDATLQPVAKKTLFQRFLPLLLLAAGFVAFFAAGLDEYLSWNALVDHNEWLIQQVSDNAIASFLIYSAAYILVVAFSIPGGAIMTLVGGYLFGTLIGGTATVLGATIGACLVFLAARTALGDLFRKKAGGALLRMERGFQENALSYLLVLRLIPLFPFWLVNIVPALLEVPLRTYFIGTLLGIIPGTFVYASVGAGLGTLLAQGRTPDLGIIFNLEIFMPLIGLSLLSLLPVAYRKIKARRDKG
jgi:uncharacterized membrane protein YdjX (TVP38/TMEM64 family)